MDLSMHHGRCAGTFRKLRLYAVCLSLLGIAAAGCGSSTDDSAGSPSMRAGEETSTTPSQNPVTFGKITGIVSLNGPVPKRRPVEIDDECSKHLGGAPLLSDREIVSEEGGVQFAFVYVTNPPAGDYPVPEERAVLTQEGCRYIPHVIGYRVGQKLSVVNSDPFTHNVRSFAKVVRQFNMGQPAGTPPRIKSYDEAELHIKLKCDVHRWMQGYMFIMEHPFFAVTDEKGRFEIGDLPSGTYTLTAWHEFYGEMQFDVTVEVGEAVGNVSFDRPRKN